MSVLILAGVIVSSCMPHQSAGTPPSQFKPDPTWNVNQVTLSCAANSKCDPAVGALITEKIYRHGVKEETVTYRCTSFLISPNRVLTDNHCIDGALKNGVFPTNMHVFFLTANGSSRPASVHPVSRALHNEGEAEKEPYSPDYAVLELKTPLNSPPPLPLTSMPLELTGNYSMQVVNARDKGQRHFEIQQVKNCKIAAPNVRFPFLTSDTSPLIAFVGCTIQQGNSGAPVFNNQGQAVAVLQAIFVDEGGWPYSAPDPHQRELENNQKPPNDPQTHGPFESLLSQNAIASQDSIAYNLECQELPLTVDRLQNRCVPLDLAKAQSQLQEFMAQDLIARTAQWLDENNKNKSAPLYWGAYPLVVYNPRSLDMELNLIPAPVCVTRDASSPLTLSKPVSFSRPSRANLGDHFFLKPRPSEQFLTVKIHLQDTDTAWARVFPPVIKGEMGWVLRLHQLPPIKLPVCHSFVEERAAWLDQVKTALDRRMHPQIGSLSDLATKKVTPHPKSSWLKWLE